MSCFHKDGHARFHHYQRRAHRFFRFRHSRHASGGNFKGWFWRRDGLFIAAAHAFGALARPRPVGLAAGFSVVRFLCRLEILPPSRAPHCHRHDFGRLFGASFGLAAL